MQVTRTWQHGFALLGAVVSFAILAVLSVVAIYLYKVNRAAVSPTQQLSQNVREINNVIANNSGLRLDLSNQELTSVPNYVFGMTKLEELNLSGNNLTGALPAEIRHLTNLRILNVSNNQMTGIPAEVGQLSQLEVLNYAYNQIIGLPYEIANLKKLQRFDLTANNFSQQDLATIKKDLPNLNVIY